MEGFKMEMTAPISAMRTLLPPSKQYMISLPKIHFKEKKAVRQSPAHISIAPSQSEAEEILKLDEWSNSLPTVKRKRNQTSQSIAFLYKTNNKYNSLQSSKYKQGNGTELGPAGLYLAQLESELNKIKKINYSAIYQNVQYCAGVYEIAFNDILKKLDGYKKMIQEIFEVRKKSIEEFRQLKIEQMKANRNNHGETERNKSRDENFAQISPKKYDVHKLNRASTIGSVHFSQFTEKIDQATKVKNFVDLKQIIEIKYQQLKPIKRMLQKIQQQRLKILMASLQMGYDVREEGLTWILKELNNQQTPFRHRNTEDLSKDPKLNTFNMTQIRPQKQKHIPKICQFPNFLTEQQINFIISKFKNDFKLKDIEEQKEGKEQLQKTILHNAFENVRRDRSRKLSMIKQKELLIKLLSQKKQQIALGHKYINAETLRIMQNSQKIKSTTNELIYQETMRKLNRFCIQQIYRKKDTREKENDKSINNAQRVGKLMEEIKVMLSDVHRLRKKEEVIKNEEEKELSDIMMKLRSQIYEGRITSEKRNPISVICCLVGWRKAKKILENQMNISMPGGHS